MVFEELVTPWDAKRHPKKLFFLGIVFSLLAAAFGWWVFPGSASLVMVFLLVIMVMPLMYFTLRDEEQEDLRFDKEWRLLKEHSKAIRFLLYLFLGFVVGFSLLYILLPESIVQNLFSSQLQTIENINSNDFSGHIVVVDMFIAIFTNNLKVMFFSLLFALAFGAGAIFILAWNASVISAAVGTYFRNGLAKYATIAGFDAVAVHFNLFVSGLFRYLIHGMFEIAAYFVAGFAGGILSIALINKNVRMFKLTRVIKDSCWLIAIAILLLIVGALVEVFLTPVLF